MTLLDKFIPDATDQSVAIEFNNVSKAYTLYPSRQCQLLDQIGAYKLRFWRSPPKFSAFPALDGINLTIKRGERVGIIGRNGSGKTTLLKLITGNFVPTSGQITVNGSVQALMGLGVGFHPELSGYDNIWAALSYTGIPAAEFDKALEDIIDFAELGAFLHQPMKTYSLGMNTRVQFATATAIKPDILIIDEVMSAGDAYFAAKSAHRMRKLIARENSTFLLVAHSMPQVVQFCSRVIWLNKGHVMMDGEAKDVTSAYEVFSEQQSRGSNEQLGGRSTVGDRRLRDKPWIGENILAQSIDPAGARKGGGQGAADQPRAEDKEGWKEFQVTLANGLRVYRWPSMAGLKFRSLELISNGTPVDMCRYGDPLKISGTVAAERDDYFRCQYLFSLLDLEGRRITWITSTVDSFTAKAGDLRRVEVDLGRVLLGAGDYVLNAEIFDGTGMEFISSANRYDLLARCMELRVLPEIDVREAPVFYHPASFRMSAD